VDLAEIDVVDEVDAGRLGQLVDLYAAEWWTATRTSDEVAQMLRATDLVVGLVHRPADRLVGFSRVLTDGEYVAVILDVIVAADWRQAGLGALLLDTLVGHPRLAKVQSLELVCQPGLVPFYGRWGFTDQVGGSRLMRRTSDPRLIS
jgi:predicted GNAT family N-acyltransferase